MVKRFNAVPPIRKIRCAVDRIINHGNQVYTLILIPEKTITAFHPGQFLHLALDEYDPSGFWPESRAFSIASSPTNHDQLKISYSVKGKFTRRMENELIEGSHVWVKLPYGEFFVKEDRDVVLIAGGTGISAFIAFLESLKPETKNQVYLFYGARSENLLIYNESIAQIAHSVPNFHLNYALEIPPQGGVLDKSLIHLGRLDITWILESISEPKNADYFLSGPPIMINSFTTELKSKKISADHIIVDAWGD
jgi:NAD(P)H-flavin reductase